MAEPALRRELGVWGAAAIVVGTVIGGGIFLKPQVMIQQVGTPEMVFLVWVFGGLLSLFGALTYAELAAAMPEAGGEYVYLREAYGPFWGFVYAWTQLVVAKSGSVAALGASFMIWCSYFRPELKQVLGYVPLPLGKNGGPLEITQEQVAAVVLILALGFLNYLGVKTGGRIQIAITIVKVALIGAVIGFGLAGGQANAANLSTAALHPVGGFAGFFTALLAALWAYDGWNNLNMVSGEVKNPQRNLPIALIAGTAAVVVLYLLINAAYFLVVEAPTVARDNLVAATMMRRVVGDWGAGAVSLAAMVSTFAALNGSILSGSRIPYALAADRLFFPAVAKVHPRFGTPAVSIGLLTAWSAVLVLSGKFNELTDMVVFASWILYAMATASVFVFRVRRPAMSRPYKTFGYPLVPAAFVLVAALLLGNTLWFTPRESLLGLGLIISGVPVYWYWRRRSPRH